MHGFVSHGFPFDLTAKGPEMISGSFGQVLIQDPDVRVVGFFQHPVQIRQIQLFDQHPYLIGFPYRNTTLLGQLLVEDGELRVW